MFCETSAEFSVGRKRCHPVAFSGNRSGALTQQLLGTARQGFFPLYLSLTLMYSTVLHELREKRRMCITVYVDSVNYQFVILALVSTCVSFSSLSLALCCCHPCTELAECLGGHSVTQIGDLVIFQPHQLAIVVHHMCSASSRCAGLGVVGQI